MNARITDKTQTFVKEVKELERLVLNMATLRGLGERQDVLTRGAFVTAWRAAQNSLAVLEAGAGEVFSQAKRLLDVASLEDAEQEIAAELEAELP